METIWIIVIISILGPIIGSLLGIIRKPTTIFLYNLLSFTAGVMLTLSFANLIPQSIQVASYLICALGLALGAIVMFIVDKTITHIHPGLNAQEQGKNIKRTAIYLIIGIFLHHLPEGFAIALGGAVSMNASLTIAIALAIHDIAEGICTCAPYYYCNNNKWKSFLVSSSTVLPTLIGFFIGYYFLPYISLTVAGLAIAMTAGIMIYISADELIPESSFKLSNHSTIFSLIAGILFVIVLNGLML
jgi:ZIP family zinc transporter